MREQKDLQQQTTSIFSNQTPSYYGDTDDAQADLVEAEKAQEAESACCISLT